MKGSLSVIKNVSQVLLRIVLDENNKHLTYPHISLRIV